MRRYIGLKTRDKNMTKKNTERVVLNLKQSEAIELNTLLKKVWEEGSQVIEKISKQLNKTIAKNQIIDNLRKQGQEPTKEQIKIALNSAGIENGEKK